MSSVRLTTGTRIDNFDIKNRQKVFIFTAQHDTRPEAFSLVMRMCGKSVIDFLIKRKCVHQTKFWGLPNVQRIQKGFNKINVKDSYRNLYHRWSRHVHAGVCCCCTDHAHRAGRRRACPARPSRYCSRPIPLQPLRCGCHLAVGCQVSHWMKVDCSFFLEAVILSTKYFRFYNFGMYKMVFAVLFINRIWVVSL